jgi:para-aminobenzoate synthetase/4-amino-4-deoxychorismate lyase
VTEGAISNLVARIGGELVTPPFDCGLLPGIFREELLDSGAIRERVITAAELEQAEELYLINSVRKWRRAVLVK